MGFHPVLSLVPHTSYPNVSSLLSFVNVSAMGQCDDFLVLGFIQFKGK